MDISEFLIVFGVAMILLFSALIKKQPIFSLFSAFAGILGVYLTQTVISTGGITGIFGSTPSVQNLIPYNNTPFILMLVLFVIICFTVTIVNIVRKYYYKQNYH